MTELAGQQFNSGDSEHALETLKLVQRYADKIHTGVVDDSKKLQRQQGCSDPSLRLAGNSTAPHSFPWK
jgi:hypothetical protein